MSNARHDPAAGTGVTGGDWWTRRPRRSTNDRKVAGVAGGLGRAFGVDPVLIRVGFVVLTVLGGAGGLLYVLGWLLLPADGDEVSAAESLLGRGRSSTPPILAVVLAIVAACSIASMFSWGLPFWPLVIGTIIVITVIRKRRQGCPGHNADGSQVGSDEWAARMTTTAQSWGEQAEQWVARQPWSGTPNTGAPSPFDKPPFWEEGTGTGGVSLTKETPAPAGTASAATQEPVAPQPPAWDPLGAAPFAWDLPEPAPAPAPPTPRRRSVVGRVTMGAVLLVGGLATAGIFAGWWHLTWAGVAATALAVVALGLLIGSLRGRGQSLIGPGIFLSVLTLGLTVTGIDGTTGYGQQTWAPLTVAAAERAPFELNGGQGTLDLTRLTVPAGQTADVAVEVRAGEAMVTVPSDVAVNATCTANAGQLDCLGVQTDGLNQEVTSTQDGTSDRGTINLTVHVGAGHAEVRNG